MLKKYYRLTKPGIVYGNVMSTAAGFLLAAGRHAHWVLLFAALAGTALIIASACVVNNYIDQGIDEKMERTQKRALVRGTISGRSALVYALVLGLLGYVILFTGTNVLTCIVGVTGYIFYVAVYGYAKRKSIYGTIVGSVSGSMPIVAGYTAVTGRLDLGAWLLYAIMTAWQMPHFYAIAMFRFKDYKAAGLPVWPVKNGMRSTKVQIVLFAALFAIACVLLTLRGYAGITFMIVMALTGGFWLWKGIRGFQSVDDTPWARSMFGFSLIALLVLSVSLSVNAWLP